jgi:hypothetical protein
MFTSPIFPRVLGPVDALGWPVDRNEPLDMSDPFADMEPIGVTSMAHFGLSEFEIAMREDIQDAEIAAKHDLDNAEDYAAMYPARPRLRRRSAGGDSTSTACRESEGMEA